MATQVARDKRAQTRYLNVPETADYLDVGERVVRRLVAERRIAFHRVGRHIRFDVADARNTATTADMIEVAAGLRRLLDAIRDGTLTVGSGEVARLEGALSAIGALVVSTGREGSPDEPSFDEP